MSFWGLIKLQWLAIFYLYTLPLARPAQAKIQMLTNFKPDYHNSLKILFYSRTLQNYFQMTKNCFLLLKIRLKIIFLKFIRTWHYFRIFLLVIKSCTCKLEKPKLMKSPPWTILWFRILEIFSVENIASWVFFVSNLRQY